ncbi:hypothetical protein THASP1DRAFT_23714 [Thamnocephalis sphaerospora]|uniref:ER membrane protein complex subunit 7 beta-sandwich domain-containing protein n=1 Tax=Thamnocephalis sphaerospora TaxID=78915 RepID=A0A4P9XQE5_9FUNG|nr:hypothetical protein THASP1DRAFT_23714 [Thamnocephalis sphaerospora]|eukprot:RKP08257.1 hypothetical protein THASP1DRAFT_23714 [Thamnocephalis sphaerospora]
MLQPAMRGSAGLQEHVAFDPALLTPDTRVVLDNGRYTGHLRQDGGFIIPGVPDGDYLLEVWTANMEFPKVKLSIENGAVQATVSATGAEWGSPGAGLPYPLTLSPLAQREFFAKREGFNIMSLFANPYMLMMGFSVIMLVVMPKMMKNMDPEALQEMQQNQADLHNSISNVPDISQKLANFFSPKE